MTVIPRPVRERRVLMDSSAYLALLDEDDEHHARAVQIVTQLARLRFRQYTTNVVIIECHALLLSTLGRDKAAEFLREMRDSETVVIRVRAADEERAQQIIFQYDDKDFSLTDAISFAVMERLNVAQAFTFDRHFVQYGLSVVEPLMNG